MLSKALGELDFTNAITSVFVHAKYCGNDVASAARIPSLGKHKRHLPPPPMVPSSLWETNDIYE